MLAIYFCVYSTQLAAEGTVTLRLPPSGKYGDFITQLYQEAYQDLGLKVKFVEMPGSRELQLANQGIIDGVLARVDGFENKYNSLTKIPIALFDFQMNLLADRRQCGICDVSQIRSIAIINGSSISEQFVQTRFSSKNIVRVNSVAQAQQLVFKKRVDAGLYMAGDEVEQPSLSHHFIEYPVLTGFDYHYINNKNSDHVKRVTQSLRKMEQSGRLTALRKQYDISLKSESSFTINTTSISAISGEWSGYTNSDGTGVYWEMLNDIFPSLKVTSTTWGKAKQAFSQQRQDILVGPYALETNKPNISNTHIDYEYPVYAISLKSNNTFGSKGKDAFLNETKNATFCKLSGAVYGIEQKIKGNVEQYQAVKTCYKKLAAKQVDFVIDNDYNIPQSLTLQVQQIELIEAMPLFIEFQATNRGNMLKRRFEEVFRRHVLSGKVKAYYENEYDYFNARLSQK